MARCSDGHEWIYVNGSARTDGAPFYFCRTCDEEVLLDGTILREGY